MSNEIPDLEHLTPDQFKELCEEAIKDPNGFAAASVNMHPKLLLRVLSVLTTVLLHGAHMSQTTLQLVIDRLDKLDPPEGE